VKLLSIILISCLGIFVYSNTFFCSFHFDDIPYIVGNFYIRDIHNLQNIWNWWPCRFITFFSFAFNYHFYQFNVVGYHLFNLVVHLVSAIFVWWLVNLTFSTPAMKEAFADEAIGNIADLVSLFSGLVFVSHPIQTQAVTFIWQRAASMAALFYLASLCFYVKSRLSVRTGNPAGRPYYYILSLITAMMAMFTKENAITLPLMIVLYEFSFFRTNRRVAIPFLLIFLIIPLTWTLSESEKFQARHSFFTNISSMQYLLTEFRVILTYIRLAFLPYHQNLDYDYSHSKSIFEVSTFSSFIFLIVILLFAKRMFSKYRLVSFSIFWFFLTLLPESSFFPFADVIEEHRLYLPLAGYSMFLVSGAYYVIVTYCHFESPSLRSRAGSGRRILRHLKILRCAQDDKRLWLVVLMMIIACYSVLTYQRNKVWKDEFTLWSDVVRKSPHKARPYNSLGLIYEKQGNSTEALGLYNKAIEIFPNYAEAYNNRGLLYYKQDNFTAALSDYNKAIEIKPDLVNAHNNRGLLYTKEGKFTQAILDFNRCIELNPNFAKGFVNRGIVWARQGNFTQSLSDYTRAIKINPNDPRF